MSNKLSFSEYCKSKDALRLAVDSTPQITMEYELTKYCKFPIVSDDETEYVAFKPKDKIRVLWEFLNPEQPTPRQVTVTTEDEEVTSIKPAWNDRKLSSWIEKNTSKEAK